MANLKDKIPEIGGLMSKALSDLIKISKKVGKDSALVQAEGGNTSVKTADGKYMYIKSSGTALKDMNERAGWRRVRLDAVSDIILDKRLAKLETCKREKEVINRLLLACDDNMTDGARPSIESHLHALLDKYVVHLHPWVIGAYVSSRTGKDQFEKIFAKNKSPGLWIPYADPGYMLAKKIARLVGGYQAQYGRKPAVMIAAKHGLFVTAESVEGVLRLVDEVICVCGSKLKKSRVSIPKSPGSDVIKNGKSAISEGIFEATGKKMPVDYISTNETIAAFMAHKDAPRLLGTAAINSAELVLVNGPAMWLEEFNVGKIVRRLCALISKGRRVPKAYLVKGLGLFIAAREGDGAVAAEGAVGSLKVRIWAAQFGGVVGLTKRQKDFIDEWESDVIGKTTALVR